MSGDPFPKASQLARGERRYRRRVASPKQWQAIIAAKRGPCRVCSWPLGFKRFHVIEYHHLVSRAQLGDDTEDNIVPVCSTCHPQVTARHPDYLAPLAESLTAAERAYVVGKLGEAGLERLFGVGVSRTEAAGE